MWGSRYRFAAGTCEAGGFYRILGGEGSSHGRLTPLCACVRRNEVERTINRLMGLRAVATRYDKRAYVFPGTVTAATIRLWLQARFAGDASVGAGIFHRRDARRQQRLRVLRDHAPSEPEDAYLVFVVWFFVIANVEEPIGTRGNYSHMLEQFDNIRRRAVIGVAAQVDERLAVHPPEVKQVRAVHLGDMKPKVIDDLSQTGPIVVISCGFSDRDPTVVLKHPVIVVRWPASQCRSQHDPPDTP